MRPPVLAAAAAALLVATSSPVAAHEIGKTQVTAAIDPVHRTYQIDVVVDPDALLTRLQILATGDVTLPHDRVDRDRQLSALCAEFLRAVRLEFGGVAVVPAFRHRA